MVEQSIGIISFMLCEFEHVGNREFQLFIFNWLNIYFWVFEPVERREVLEEITLSNAAKWNQKRGDIIWFRGLITIGVFTLLNSRSQELHFN